MHVQDDIEDIYELSSIQQGLLFHSLDSPKSGIYCVRLVFTMRGELDVSAFHRSWQYVLDRHEVLRTSFHWQELENPLQVVHRRVQLEVEQLDWRALSLAGQEKALETYLKEDAWRGFDFTIPPLMRLALVRGSEDTYCFLWSFHHLILDGWCRSALTQEVWSCYEAFCRGESVPIERPRRYRDYIIWLQQQDLRAAEAFWREELKDFSVPTRLGVNQVAQGIPAHEDAYDKQYVRLSQSITTALQSFARRHRLTLNTLLQGAWAILLSHYSNEEDVVFGATVANRPVTLEGIQATLGLFINTLPVRVQVSAEALLVPWLTELQAHQAHVRQYAYSPLADIQGWSEVRRGQPLFDSILACENYPGGLQQTRVDGLEICLTRGFDWPHYPLCVEALPGAELVLVIMYDSRCFDGSTITRMADHLRTLLEGMEARPQCRLRDLPLLTEAERRRLVVEWNNTARDYPRDRTLHELFEMQVERTPDAVAVVFEERHLTYRELNRRSNQLAHYLRMLGVGPEVLVGLCVERSLEIVVGILGILKAGGAYVPLDPSYPTARLAFMLEDAQVAVLLTQQRMLERVAAHPLPQGRAICLDADWELVSQQSNQNPRSRVVPENLAYVIYTSGSTGQPKGAMILHRGLINYLTWCELAYPVADGQGSVVHSSIAFDLTVTSLFAPLLQGRRVMLVREELGMEGLSAALRQEHDLSLIKITPSHLQLLGQQLSPEKAAGRTSSFHHRRRELVA